jgi:hypothetical protein
LRPGRPGTASFIFFIPGEDQEKLVSIARELKVLSGLRKLDVTPVSYNIKESLFSTFLHKTLKVGKQEKLKGKDLVLHIQTALDKKGLDFLSINILNDNDEKVSFTPADQNLFIDESVLLDSDALKTNAPPR